MSERRLTHLDEQGRARMVDVAGKDTTLRVARARARLRMSSEAARAVESGQGPKGEVLGVARLAGIQAAKRTDELIPLAHQVALTFVDVQRPSTSQQGIVELVAEAHALDRTGVEMEAMTAAAVAALTVYDMVKGLERGVEIEQVALLEKTGGRHDWRRERAPDGAPAGGAHLDQHLALGGEPPRTAAGEAPRALRRRALGVEVHAFELIPDDRGGSKRACAATATSERCELILTSGGTGRVTERRHARGHAGGDRARGPRDRRGAARGLPRAHPQLDALACAGRHPRRDA